MMRLAALLFFLSCNTPSTQTPDAGIILGAEQIALILSRLEGKRVGILVNHTSMVGNTHLADTLLSRGANVKKIYAPEHGFRGSADAGEHIQDGVDPKTKLPVISLYGNSRKATPEQLQDIDIVVFDIQDVGARFYTYIGSLHYMMEACAENNIMVIVLDRPNPNGHFVDGPVLQMEFKSFVGMHPVPITHGMTVGEYAQMINGEGWLKNGVKCELEIISMKNYTHQTPYALPVKPSPNLPNDNAIGWYPSTCLFEGTTLSVGRGTHNPFEEIGHPDLKNYSFQFTPVSIDGMSKTPPLENRVCYGIDLRNEKPEAKVSLKYLLKLYHDFPGKDKFFKSYFNTLAGSPVLQQQIKDGLSEEEIRAGWQPGLEAFNKVRKKYLIYP